MILWNKNKEDYDPKIEMVKYLGLFDQKDQNKSWLIFNTASKMCKFPGLVSSYSVSNEILLKLRITTVQTLKCCYLKFEQNVSYIGWGYTSPLKSVAIIFNLTV